MKILHVIGLAHGGAGQHVLSLAAGCDPRRYEATVAMTESSSMRPRFERAGVRVIPLVLDHYGGPRKNLLAFKQLSGILKNESFDIVQTHTSVAGALGRVAARLFTKTPVVHMIHAFAGHPYRSTPFRLAARIVERQLDRFTDWYIAGSRAMVQRGIDQRIFTANKVELIHNGIDLAPFTTPHGLAERRPARPSDAPVTIGFLGRLEKQKGVPYLIEAAALVKAQLPNVRIVIAGDGQMRGELEAQAARLCVTDIVEFVGWQQDAAAFLGQIDIMAMPSLWEAFGLSAAEAMALGKPVIASAIEGLPEVIEDGVTGLLVPRADSAGLAAAIVELGRQPERWAAMGAAGRQRVETLFSLDRMIERHEEFYDRVAGIGTAPLTGDEKRRAETMALSLTQ